MRDISYNETEVVRHTYTQLFLTNHHHTSLYNTIQKQSDYLLHCNCTAAYLDNDFGEESVVNRRDVLGLYSVNK